MTYETLLDTMRAAALPVLAVGGLITLGAVCDMWTNSIASAGSRVWHQFKASLKDFSPN